MYRVPDIEELQAENKRLKVLAESYEGEASSRWHLERDLERARDTIRKLQDAPVPWWVPLLPVFLGIVVGCELLQTYFLFRGL